MVNSQNTIKKNSRYKFFVKIIIFGGALNLEYYSEQLVRSCNILVTDAG